MRDLIEETAKNAVISNEPLGDVRDLIALRSGYTMRFFIPMRSIQNDNERQRKNVVISNEPSGEMRDLSGDAMCCNGRQ
jgi:hypothetical protein